MTVNDPRPELAAMLAARLAPAAEALALAYAEDMNAGPSPEDRRACEGRGQAGAGATVGGQALRSHRRQKREAGRQAGEAVKE